jgi:hypothetical protein
MGLLTWKMNDRDIVYPIEVITGVDAVTQRLENRLKLFRGSWPDSEAGIDWLDIFNGDVNNERLRIVIKQELEADEFVDEVTEITIDFDRPARIVRIDFVSRGVEGISTGSVEVTG